MRIFWISLKRLPSCVSQEVKEDRSSFICPLCNKNCMTQHQLTMHIRQVCASTHQHSTMDITDERLVEQAFIMKVVKIMNYMHFSLLA